LPQTPFPAKNRKSLTDVNILRHHANTSVASLRPYSHRVGTDHPHRRNPHQMRYKQSLRVIWTFSIPSSTLGPTITDFCNSIGPLRNIFWGDVTGLRMCRPNSLVQHPPSIL